MISLSPTNCAVHQLPMFLEGRVLKCPHGEVKHVYDKDVEIVEKKIEYKGNRKHARAFSGRHRNEYTMNN